MEHINRQANGYNILVLIISLFFVLVSYSITRDIISVESVSEAHIVSFFRGAFVFLSPCGLEGIELLIARKTRQKVIDYADVTLGILSILFSFYLLYALVVDRFVFSVNFVLVILLIYPLRIVISMADYIIKSFKDRS